MKYLLDTNVVSEMVAKQPNPRVLQWLDSLDADSVYISVITIGELRKGIEKLGDGTRKQALLQWLYEDLPARFAGRILTLDVEAMLEWGAMTGQMARAGTPLPAIDSLIAALARHYGCILVTRNETDLAPAGIDVANPWR